MLIVWILLWIITAIILIIDYKTESTIWLAGVTFLTGLGAISTVLVESIMNYFIVESNISQSTISLVHSVNAIIMSIVYSFTAYCMLLYGLSYAKLIPKNKKKIIYTILFIPSVLYYIFLPIKCNYLKTPEELILFFRKISLWNVPYMVGSIILLIYSYITEKSYIIKRHKLLTVIIIVPAFSYVLLSNIILRALGIENSWRYFVILIPIQFTGFLFFSYKYGVLGVRLKFHRYKFAFENIFEFVSDSIITLDENLNVRELNKEFSKKFLVENKEYKKFHEIIEFSRISKYKDNLINLIEDSKYNEIKRIEVSIKSKTDIEYFEVLANPIIIKTEYMGTVLVFKDITVHKKNLELIKQNQFQLIEKERLLSLSQLIGGVAHNLKTPLMSSAGGIQIIKRDLEKITEYINNNCNEDENITKLVDEINDWQHRIKEYLIYMSNVITAVKGQIKEYDETEEIYFSVKELIENITLLMDFKIKKYRCTLVKELNINIHKKIKGDINSLTQVLDNLISNALEASKEGNIIILGIYQENNKVVFFVKNFGKKITEEIQKKIFNEMVTTNGKKGTGLGLYISKSIIKVRFNGELYFETRDKETTFFIEIPLMEAEKHGKNRYKNNDY